MATDLRTEPLPDESHHIESPYLGASKIRIYLECGLRYYRQYVLKERVPSSALASVGVVCHKVIQMAHEARWTEANAQDAADTLKAEWQNKLQYVADPDNPEAARRITAAALEWIPWYLHWTSKQTTICAEEHWQLEYQGVMLEGTIDRVYRESGRVILSDLKTGQRKPTPVELANDPQLSMYSWALREMDLREDVAEQVWLQTKDPMRTTRSDEYLQTFMEQVVLPAAHGIAEGVFVANTQSRYGCKFCQYLEVCEIGRGSQTPE